MTVASFFDGIGGGPEAFRRAGAVTVATCEIDEAAAGVAADHFPEAKAFTDIRELTADALLTAGFCPVCGVVVAGFPCQDLSLAGRRAGLDGARSGLFFEIVRIARDLRPRWLVLENVPGLLSSVCPCPGSGACGRGCVSAHPVRGGACGPGRCVEIHGGAMGAVLGAVAELGYGFAYRVLDAQHFGVPQRRRRVFIVGCPGDGRAPAEVLLEPEGRERDPAAGGPAWSRTSRSAVGGTDGTRIANALTSNMAGGGGGADDNTAQGGHLIAAMIDVAPSVTAHHGRNNPGQDGLVPLTATTLRARDAKKSPDSDATQTLIAYQGQGTNVGPMGTLRAGNGNVTGGVPFTVIGEVAHTLTAAGSDASEDETGRGTPIVVAGAVKEGARYPNHESTMVPIAFGHTNGLDVQASEHVTPTLRAGHDVGGGSVASAAAVRRLTPTECERLQGYPDGWTALSHGKAQADSARYRQLGNSYALPVVEWIARRIIGWSA